MSKKLILVLASPLFLLGCTYSQTMVHTEGTASDVVDETQSQKADVTANVPISGV